MTEKLKAELLDQCEARGVPHDKRWGPDRLKAALAAHAAEGGNLEGGEVSPPEGEADEYAALLEEENETLKATIAQLERQLEDKARADQASALSAPPKQPVISEDDGTLRPGNVFVRVLKKGDGKVSTGGVDAGGRSAFYGRGAVFQCGQKTAAALEARGYVEIEDDE